MGGTILNVWIYEQVGWCVWEIEGGRAVYTKDKILTDTR